MRSELSFEGAVTRRNVGIEMHYTKFVGQKNISSSKISLSFPDNTPETLVSGVIQGFNTLRRLLDEREQDALLRILKGADTRAPGMVFMRWHNFFYSLTRHKRNILAYDFSHRIDVMRWDIRGAVIQFSSVMEQEFSSIAFVLAMGFPIARLADYRLTVDEYIAMVQQSAKAESELDFIASFEQLADTLIGNMSSPPLSALADKREIVLACFLRASGQYDLPQTLITRFLFEVAAHIKMRNEVGKGDPVAHRNTPQHLSVSASHPLVSFHQTPIVI